MKQFIKNNPFIFATIICSVMLFLISIEMCTFVLLPIAEDNIGIRVNTLIMGYSLLYLLGILIINSLTVFLKKKFTKQQNIIKLISFIANSIILFSQALMCLGIIVMNYLVTHPDWDAYKPIRNPEQYQEAINSISRRRGIKHFPKTIPNGAKNVALYSSTMYFKDYSSEMLLKFDIDKSYIKKEISKDKCRKIIYKKDNYSIYPYVDLYEIENNTNKDYQRPEYAVCILNPQKSHSELLEYGVLFNGNQIIYYYRELD